MKKYFKFLKFDSKDLNMEKGNHPVETIVPLGPPFKAKDNEKHWLKQNAQGDSTYVLERFCSLEQLANLKEETKEDNHG